MDEKNLELKKTIKSTSFVFSRKDILNYGLNAVLGPLIEALEYNFINFEDSNFGEEKFILSVKRFLSNKNEEIK